MLGMLKQLDLRWCSAWGMLRCAVSNGVLLEMFKYLLDDCWVLHTSDDLDWTLAFLTDLDIDIA